MTLSSDLRTYGLNPDYIVEPGELNTALIYDMVAWAEKKEERRSVWANWGNWKQGVWADLTMSHTEREGLPVNLTLGMVQEKNVCGTAFCMAGQAVAQAGYEFIGLGGGVSVNNCIKVEPTDEFDDKGFRVMREVGEERSIEQVGAEVLGLDGDEKGWFFAGNNPIEYLKSLSNGLCEERGLPVLFPDAEYPSIYAEFEAWCEENTLDPDDFGTDE